MHWYLVHTKPRQEKSALLNLEQQGYPCYLPTLPIEKLRHGAVALIEEPLFPRYLFIRLGQDQSAKSWAPVRSTKGVSRLVSFGVDPVKVDDVLIDQLRAHGASLQSSPKRLFTPGERVSLNAVPFAGIQGIYQMVDGEHRALVLIELLSKQVTVRVPVSSVRRVG